jgi:hypothetical protein
MPEPNEIRAALYKTLSSGEVARSIGSAGLRHLHAVFEEELGARGFKEFLPVCR